MSVIRSLGLGCSFCLITFFCLLPISISAQTTRSAESPQADHDQTLRQLLTEVRELRLALERTTVTNTRFQMLIERLRTQQTQVDLLSRQLASVRSQLVKLKAAKTEAAARMKELEDGLSQPSSDEIHAAIESGLKQGKRAMESQAAEEQQQLESEANLLMRLQVEDGKLTDLNGQLDLLLKELKGP